jgi:excisionase family DNA binding protein
MRPNAVDDLTLLTVKQVARRLAISVRSVWRHVRSRRLPAPFYPTPRAPRWRRTDLERFLDNLGRQENGHA